MSQDRRADPRIPVEIPITQFIGNRPFRSVASDLSHLGLCASRHLEPMARSSRVIQLELPLPGIDEPLWASAEVVFDALDPFVHSNGVRFLSMARAHRRILDTWIHSLRNGRIDH